MGHTQLHPLGGKFCVGSQKGHEIGGKRRGPSSGFGAYNALCGDAEEPHIHPSGGHGVIQNLIQHLGIGIAAPEDTFPVVFLTRLQRLGVLFICFLSAQMWSLLAGVMAVWPYYRETFEKTQGDCGNSWDDSKPGFRREIVEHCRKG